MDFLETIIAGDTLDFTVEVVDFPASDGWTLKYRLTPRFTTPTQTPIDLTATTNADGERYDIQVAPATTVGWKAGFYTWARWVEKAGARQTLNESGQLEVKADPALTAQGYDSRSHPRKVLEAIEAVIESRASQTQREMVAYTIGSRSQTLDAQESKAALLELHSKYKWLVANEDALDKIAVGLPNPRNVGIRFGRP
jgi:hypothetical protein